MQNHMFRLPAGPYAAIAAGKKTIESRLYDEKRQLIQIGDTITFRNRQDSQQSVVVRVIGLLRYASFENLFSHNDPHKFDGPNTEWLLNQIREFYSTEDERVHGVVGIEFELK